MLNLNGRWLYKLLIALICILAANLGIAAPLPGPVTIIMPFPAGGPYDAVARALAEQLTNIWRIPVVVDNRTGAGGRIGTQYVVRAKPDGTILLLNSGSLLAVQNALFKNMPYNPSTDLRAISGIANLPLLFVANPKLDARNFSEFINLARRNPGKISVGSAGIGSGIHGVLELMQADTGVQILHVPYRGSSPSVLAIMAGDVDVILDVPTASIQHVKEGKLRALAITGPVRMVALPNVPTVSESGFPNLTSLSWLGLFAPKGTPDDVVQSIDSDVRTAFRNPAFVAAIEKIDITPAYQNHQQVTQFLASEVKRFSDAAKKLGLEPIDVQ